MFVDTSHDSRVCFMAPLFESSFVEKLFSSINQISDVPPNPFPHLNSSFSAPTTKEVIALKDAFANSSSVEKSIEKLLARLKDVEKTIQKRLNAQRNYRSCLRCMLSTIHFLPPEVLSIIFLLCSPDEINHYSSATFSNRSTPWSISRVCRKWRSICLSTPRLWLHIPTINRKCKSGFFELLRTTAELSLPYDIKLRIRDIDAEKIERFENILPRVHALDVHLNLPMIKGLVQRKESFKHLKSATIFFTSNSSEEPPTLDFLTPVTSLTLSCRHLQRTRDDPDPYALLRSVHSHWPNLTTFHGDRLPPSFLRGILFAAPFLQNVTLQDVRYTSFDANTASPPATSDVCHVNLRYLGLIGSNPRFGSIVYRALFQRLHLPGLQYLHIGHTALSPASFLSFLHETHGSLERLTLKEPLGTLDNQREMYRLCPALRIFSLSNAKPENLGILAISPQSKLCLNLRYLILRDFTLVCAGGTRVIEDFCSSRGLAPFNISNHPANSSQLECITIYPGSVFSFRRHCLRIDNEDFDPLFVTVCFSLSLIILQTFLKYKPSQASMRISHEILKEKFLNRAITTETPYLLGLLEVWCRFSILVKT